MQTVFVGSYYTPWPCLEDMVMDRTLSTCCRWPWLWYAWPADNATHCGPTGLHKMSHTKAV